MTPAYPIGARVICEATPHSREMEAVVVAVDGDRRKLAFPDHALCGSRDVSALRPHPECIVGRAVDLVQHAVSDMLEHYGTAITDGALDGAGQYTPAAIDEAAQAVADLDNVTAEVTP